MSTTAFLPREKSKSDVESQAPAGAGVYGRGNSTVYSYMEFLWLRGVELFQQRNKETEDERSPQRHREARSSEQASILFPRQIFRSPSVFSKLWPLICDSNLANQTTRKPTVEVTEDSVIPSDVGFSFCAAGLLFPYYIGVGEAFRARGVLTDRTPIAGSSAGAIAAVALASGASVEKIIFWNKELASNCNQYGTRGRLAEVLRYVMNACLPEDAHVRVSGRVVIHMTQVFPYKKLKFSVFESKEDLIDAVVASSYVPMVLGDTSYIYYRGLPVVDAFFSTCLPDIPSCKRVIKTSALPIHPKMLAVDIMPTSKSAEDGRYSLPKLAKATAFIDADGIDHLFQQGLRDAEQWISENNDILE